MNTDEANPVADLAESCPSKECGPVWVSVESDHYRTLAVRDRQGKWRCFANNEELPEPVRVLSD